MKIIRYENENGETGYAAEEKNGIFSKITGDIFGDFKTTGERVSIKKRLAPLQPAAILCIGLNYRCHAEETKAPIPKYPVLFFKGINALQNPNDPILIPTYLPSEKVDYECELAVVIGKSCKNVSPESALDYVLGYTCGNDVSARDWQKEHGGSQWCRGKTFDTFAPLGPCLVTRDEIPDPGNLAIRTLLNGEVVQEGHTKNMIFSIPELVSFLSGSTTLLPGTVILTGTPSGVGMARTPPVWLKPDDIVSIEVEKIGRLTNPVDRE